MRDTCMAVVSLAVVAALSALPCQAADPPEATAAPTTQAAAADLQTIAEWKDQPVRRWAGPAVWTNRLQDWIVRDGALICEPADANAPCRTAHALTCQLVDRPGGFRIQTVVRLLGNTRQSQPPATSGPAEGPSQMGATGSLPARALADPASPNDSYAGGTKPPVASDTAPAATGSTAGREDITAPQVPAVRGSAQLPFVGFLIGAGEGRLDYRAAAIIHHSPGKGGGFLAVYEPAGNRLVFRDMSRPETTIEFPPLDGQSTTMPIIQPGPENFQLELEAVPQDIDHYTLRLVLRDPSQEVLGVQELAGVPAARLLGNIALAASPGSTGTIFGFEDWKAGGPRLQHDPQHAFGPIAGTLYSVSNKTLNLSVQFMHLGEALLDNVPGATEPRRLRASLEIIPAWVHKLPEPIIIGPQAISPPDYCVLFRASNWDATRDWVARVVYEDVDEHRYTYETFIRRDPVDKPVISVAGFTGMGVMGRTAYQPGPRPKEGEVVVGRWTPSNVWMPFAESVRALRTQGLDVLFFTGDQIYEGKPSPKDFGRLPIDDYLYKWLLWHWSFRELTSRMPAICQADDHDVYHGNLWGWSGRLNLTGNNRDGGYLCSPSFVNMVHRTVTCHNPDAFDAGPADTGITHYYTNFTWGGVGFAILEDRKFKTPPDVKDPARQEQLGTRQMQMLKAWGEDWTGQYFKVVISQTIYASMHVDDTGKLAMDYDTNGFPKTRRDESVRMFQRCGAFILCGDQHLGTLARLGIDKPSDAVYQFCVPAMGNIFWRWFYPAELGADRKPDQPDYTGEFTDAFGNLFRMIAAANPERRELLGQKLRQRNLLPQGEAKTGLGDTRRTCMGDGYGVLRLDKKARTVTVECWPYDADPAAGGKPFPGWPITLQFDELDGRKPVAWLPDLRIEGAPDAVVQIIDQKSGEAIKITRARDGFYRPGVFTTGGTYTLRVGEPGVTRTWWTARDLTPTDTPGRKTLAVRLD